MFSFNECLISKVRLEQQNCFVVSVGVGDQACHGGQHREGDWSDVGQTFGGERTFGGLLLRWIHDQRRQVIFASKHFFV